MKTVSITSSLFKVKRATIKASNDLMFEALSIVTQLVNKYPQIDVEFNLRVTKGISIPYICVTSFPWSYNSISLKCIQPKEKLFCVEYNEESSTSNGRDTNLNYTKKEMKLDSVVEFISTLLDKPYNDWFGECCDS